MSNRAGKQTGLCVCVFCGMCGELVFEAKEADKIGQQAMPSEITRDIAREKLVRWSER